MSNTTNTVGFIEATTTGATDRAPAGSSSNEDRRWVAQFNARSLQNFLQLRTARGAHYHIKVVAMAIWDAIPQDQKFLFEDFMYGQSDE